MNEQPRTAGTLSVSLPDAARSMPGRQASSRPRSGKRPPPERKILKLLARAKTAEGLATYWRAIAEAAFDALERVPPLRQHAQIAAFVNALDALVGNDAALKAALSAAAPQMAASAAAVLMADLEAGPRAVLALARDPALAKRIAELPPSEQGIELGKLLATVQLFAGINKLYGSRA